MLIALEGIDGSGKTSTAELLPDALAVHGIAARYVDKRALTSDNDYVASHLQGLSELLWTRSRHQPIRLLGHDHWVHLNAAYFCALHESVIAPAGMRGEVLVVDGWIYKFAARAGVSSGLGMGSVLQQMQAVPSPEMVILLDVDPAEALRRRDDFHAMEKGGWGGTATDFASFQATVGASLQEVAQARGWHVVRPRDRNLQQVVSDIAQEISEVIDRADGEAVRSAR